MRIFRRVGKGENGRSGYRQQLDGGGAIAGQFVVGSGKTEMDSTRCAAPSQIGKNLRQLRRRMLPPSGFSQTVDGDIKSLASILYTVLDRSLLAAEGAEQTFALGSGIGETVLHLDDGRAT